MLSAEGQAGSIPAGAGEPTFVRGFRRFAGVYPRGCGGTEHDADPDTPATGLSPRVRGNQPHTGEQTAAGGSIPAGAGEPRARDERLTAEGVYPRGCGGTLSHRNPANPAAGLSPRVRGNRRGQQCGTGFEGSIPAGAGEPSCRRRRGGTRPVYPRGCGGTYRANWIAISTGGLSPRVRGNLSGVSQGMISRRSIPAGAGEPLGSAGSGGPSAVYPRGCGGTTKPMLIFRIQPGLSPRVRGNRCSVVRWGAARWSIPAGAGEPPIVPTSAVQTGVYPRGCGGTAAPVPPVPAVHGLSPRVRGNPTQKPLKLLERRSIPAGAGEPKESHSWKELDRVYPRGCGGTRVTLRMTVIIPGLSPRVRGNRLSQKSNGSVTRSIPAGAGEPGVRGTALRRCVVYPRGCGGTQAIAKQLQIVEGLSPRVRGNRCPPCVEIGIGGSIPAGAGEPRWRNPSTRKLRVYPRGCGGTPFLRRCLHPCRGLSPRVRGNQAYDRVGPYSRGSIPAGAGEPLPRKETTCFSPVYPRGCGGTRQTKAGQTPFWGLSPRVRGNRRDLHAEDVQAGSIPAGAGEP